MDLDFTKALSSFQERQTVRYGCLVLACTYHKQVGAPYCRSHFKAFKLGLIEGALPLQTKDRIKQAFKMVADTKMAVLKKAMTQREAEEKVYATLTKLLSKEGATGPQVTTGQFRIEDAVSTPEFIKRKQELQRKKQRDRDMRRFLSGYPLPFQVSKVDLEGDILTIVAGKRFSEADEPLRKEDVRSFLDHIFTTGREISLYASIETRKDPAPK